MPVTATATTVRERESELGKCTRALAPYLARPRPTRAQSRHSRKRSWSIVVVVVAPHTICTYTPIYTPDPCVSFALCGIMGRAQLYVCRKRAWAIGEAIR